MKAVAMMAARTSRLLLGTNIAAAGAHADGLMLDLNTAARYRRAVERYRWAATEAGRDPAGLPVSLLIPTFIHEHLPTARQAAREFLVHYARWPHHAKTFAASGYAREMAQVASAYTAGDVATPMSALSDALLRSRVARPAGERMTATLAPR